MEVTRIVLVRDYGTVCSLHVELTEKLVSVRINLLN